MGISEFLGGLPTPDAIRQMARLVGGDYDAMRDLILTKTMAALSAGWQVERAHLADLALRDRGESAATTPGPAVGLAPGADQQCPSEWELRCYARGSIGAARGFQIVGHMLDCRACSDRIDSLGRR